MIITEQDIYNYVFFRQVVPVEKVEYIEKNNLFTDEIKFYTDLKASHNPGIKSFILKPVKLQVKNNSKHLKLAAASADLKHKKEFITFSDGGSDYICRLLKAEDKLLLYVITADDESKKKLRITLYPGKETYIIENLLFPLEIPPGLEIERIVIQEV